MSIREIYNNVAGIPKDGKPRMGYEEFHQAIIDLILEEMPKEKLTDESQLGSILFNKGFNQAIAAMRERIKEICVVQ